MATPVRLGPRIEFGAPVALFRFVDPQQGPSMRPGYDVTAGGQRFIVSSIERRTDPSLTCCSTGRRCQRRSHDAGSVAT